MQGTRRLRNEAYFSYVAMTKDEAQHRRWTFYEAVLVDEPMTPLRAKHNFFVFLTAMLLLCTTNCAKVFKFEPYHTQGYQEACSAWSREARIHSGLEVELIISATFKSEEFRRAYTDEYAQAYQLTPQEKERFLQDQLDAAGRGHDFVVASFVPEKKWDDFDKPKSIWRLYLTNDKNNRVVPLEVRKLKRNDALAAHFFPYVTPWKSVYSVRFSPNLPATDEAIIQDDTKGIKLVITSVVGTAEMNWNLH